MLDKAEAYTCICMVFVFLILGIIVAVFFLILFVIIWSTIPAGEKKTAETSLCN